MKRNFRTICIPTKPAEKICKIFTYNNITKPFCIVVKEAVISCKSWDDYIWRQMHISKNNLYLTSIIFEMNDNNWEAASLGDTLDIDFFLFVNDMIFKYKGKICHPLISLIHIFVSNNYLFIRSYFSKNFLVLKTLGVEHGGFLALNFQGFWTNFLRVLVRGCHWKGQLKQDGPMFDWKG